jgi:hypothetical protein
MFLVTNFFSVFIPFWGMMGLWTTRIGFHNTVYRAATAYLLRIANCSSCIVGILLLQRHFWIVPGAVLCRKTCRARHIRMKETNGYPMDSTLKQ